MNLKFKWGKVCIKQQTTVVLTCVPGEGGWALKVRPLTDVFLLESLISDLALLRSSLNFTVVNKNAANDPDRC